MQLKILMQINVFKRVLGLYNNVRNRKVLLLLGDKLLTEDVVVGGLLKSEAFKSHVEYWELP